MRVVFDTNVLISAFLSTSGTSHIVFEGAVQNHSVLVSEYILSEFRRTLSRKLNVPGAVIDEAVQEIRKCVTVLAEVSLVGVHFSDKADIPILALVKVSRAQVLVTGDKKLLALKRFFKAAIVNPREAMEVL